MQYRYRVFKIPSFNTGHLQKKKKKYLKYIQAPAYFTVLDKNIGTLKGKPSVADPFHTFQFGPYSYPNNLLLFK